MEKLGQLRAAGRPRRDVGPRRRRHPAVPVGAGLPRRAQAAGLVPRRPVHPAARCAGQGRWPGLPQGVLRRGDPRRRRPCPRCSAGRCSATCRPSWPPWTRCSAGSASAPTRPTRCSSSRDGVRRRRRSRAGCPAGGVVLRRPARARRVCRSPGWSSTASSGVAAPGLTAARAPAAAERVADRRGRRVDAGLLRLHAGMAETAARHAAVVERFGAGHPETAGRGGPGRVAEDIHDLAGLRAVGAALAGRLSRRPEAPYGVGQETFAAAVPRRRCSSGSSDHPGG